MSLEKRLPLALLISFVMLFGWSLTQRSDPTQAEAGAPSVDPGDDPAAALSTESATESATAASDAGAGAPEVPPPGVAPVPEAAAGPSATLTAPTPVDATSGADTEPFWRELGSPGDRGHFFARFDPAGGSLLELRSGTYWVQRGLSDSERQERANRTPILVPVRYLDGEVVRTKGSLTLAPAPSARGLVPDDLDQRVWEHEDLADGVRFTIRTADGLRLTKEIRSVPGAHHLAVQLRIDNEAEAARAGQTVRFFLTAVEAIPSESEDRFYVEPKAVAGRLDHDLESVTRDLKGRKGAGTMAHSSTPGELLFLGAHSKYFAAILRPADLPARRTLLDAISRPVFDGDWVAAHPDQLNEGYRYVAADAQLELTVPQVGGTVAWNYVLYAGPKSADHFSPEDEAFKQILDADLGFFDGVAGAILRLLRLLHSVFGNWGVAIIVLTLIVRGALFPLNRRMQSSMARHATKMKRIQPRIDAIKEKYKDDPRKLREEQAKIIQQEGAIPPLGGCLPLLIQIPIFFGLFSALRVAFDLRQQPFFGWINDLSMPDRLAVLGVDLWIVDLHYLNLLPILMVVLWIGQQKVMPKPTEPQALQMHKMMMWMPIVFGLFLYDYAAGLSLYMITSSLFGIAEFTVIRKIWPLDDKERPKKQGGFMAKLAAMQEQAQKAQAQKLREQQKRSGGKGGGKDPKKGPDKGR